jgi:hypothetical protein
MMLGPLVSFFLLFPALAQNAAPALPQAQVTFYSHRVTMLGGLPGHEHAAFKGRIYDEDRQLAFMEPARFVTFNFTPGPHAFSATWWITKHATSGAHVTLDLVANQHYFIETFVVNTNLSGAVKLYITEVTCEGAQRENVSTKPLEPTHLRSDGIPLAVHETSFPQCP